MQIKIFGASHIEDLLLGLGKIATSGSGFEPRQPSHPKRVSGPGGGYLFFDHPNFRARR
jgi:hypothetical protein